MKAPALVDRVRSTPPRELAEIAVHKVPPLRATYKAYHRFRYWDPVWYHVLNRAGKTHYLQRQISLRPVQQQALDALRAEGICQLSVDELFDDPGLLERLQAEASAALASPEIAAQVAEGESRDREKSFLVRVLGERPVVDLGSELVRLALRDEVLDIAACYLGLSPRLKAFDLWYNLPVDPSSPAVLSQRWHRDYDDHRLVKMFVCLVDVDESMGPFTYARGTHSRGEYADVLPTSPPRGSNPPDGAVEAAIPPSQVKMCTGKAGTLVLCDTHGLHQGGRSVSDPRLLYMANYASDAANAPYLIDVPPNLPADGLSPAARFALRLD
jgi:hypothetical protein